MPLGQSFSPTAADQTQNQNAQPNSLQDAIRILSFSIPRLVGAQGMAPQQLMGGPGGVAGVLQKWLQALFGGNHIPLPGMPPGVGPVGPIGKTGGNIPLPGMPAPPAGPWTTPGAGPAMPTPQNTPRPGAGPLPNFTPGQTGPQMGEVPGSYNGPVPSNPTMPPGTESMRPGAPGFGPPDKNQRLTM